jgi:DNA end-binding protein Ku
MAEMVARAKWKKTVSFELANIPIQVFSAMQKDDLTSFDHLCENGHKMKNKKWCHIEEIEVPWSKIKKGYEITKNNHIVLEKEEVENIKPKTTNRD